VLIRGASADRDRAFGCDATEIENTTEDEQMNIRIGSRNVQYLDEGRGAPVVLLHPLPFDHRYWGPLITTMSSRNRVIAVDSRGFGGSELGATPYQVDDLADDLGRLLDSLQIRRATLIGVSMGGYTALAFADKFPDRVTSMVLSATKAAPDTAAQKEARDGFASLVLEQGTPAYVSRQLPRLLTSAGASSLVGLIEDLTSSASPTAVAAALRAIRDRPDRIPSLQRVAWPMLLVFGAQDAITPPSDGNDILMRLPPVPASLVVIPGAAHLPNLEQEETFTRSVLGFLDCAD
jgi:pimeloyl-ACP methyl ester carboxylesterase